MIENRDVYLKPVDPKSKTENTDQDSELRSVLIGSVNTEKIRASFSTLSIDT